MSNATPENKDPLFGERCRNVFILLTVAAGVLAYANSFRGTFVFDDYSVVVRNPAIRSLWPGAWGWVKSRGVTDFTFALNYAAGGKAAGYRAVNVAIHLACALLLFGIVRRTLTLPRVAGRFRGDAAAAAFLCATVWVTHPLTTSSVTYICQRYETMMALFYLLTLYGALRGATSEGGGTGWYLVAAAANVLGMGSKEVMVTAPVAVFLYDWMFLSGSPGGALRARWRLYAGLACAWGLLVAASYATQKAVSFALYSWSGTSPLIYLLTEFGVLAHYLRLCFWPYPLCLDYSWPAAAGLADVWPQALLVTGLGIGTLWAARRGALLSFAGIWFFLVLAPTSSVIPRPDFAFEHRMYLPLAGVTSGAVIAGYEFLRKRVGLRAVAAAGLAAILVLGVLTVLRNEDYRSEEAMWRQVVRRQPKNLRAQNDLAVALSEAGKTEEALQVYERVLSLIPADLRAKMDAGGVRVEGAIRTDSFEYHYFRAHANMGVLLRNAERPPAEAVRHFRAALGVFPGSEDVKKKLEAALRDAGQTGNGGSAGAGN